MVQTSSVVRYDPRRLGVTVRATTSRREAEALFARAGVELERAIPEIRAYLVDVEPERREQALATLRRSRLVSNAGREPLVDALDLIPNDENWPQQWGLRTVGLPQAWSLTLGSSRVVVAVLDSGVDAAHPDLRGALVPGYDFVNSDADPSDDHGHGTSVAGIIAARANNRTGGAGVCWTCSIMPVKVLAANGVGDDSVIAAGIVWAVEHGARVINLSLGGPGSSQTLTDAITYAVGKGVAIVAAAGNNGGTDLIYPAADPLAISVAATTAADQRYPWSNFGSWVRVAAPGCNVAPVRGGGEGIFCGTSSSTPLVAGLIALGFSAYPGATLAQVEAALERSAIRVPTTVQYGRVNAPGMLSLAQTSPNASARATTVFRGRLNATAKSLSLAVGAGRLVATLTSPGRQILSLALIPPEGANASSRTSRSPVRLQSIVPAGAIEFRVRGPRRATFTLSVSYVRPEKAAP